MELQVCCVLGAIAAGDLTRREVQKQVLSSYHVH
jgi:hypothetical protein